MSKWFKVEYSNRSGHLCVDDLLLDIEGRVKVTKRVVFDMEAGPATIFTSEHKWCFKFKDEADAMAFKLRLL